MTEQRFIKGALLLTYAGLLSKVLSALYRIPLQNITGDYGFFIYQQIYPLIGMATIFGLYGMPQAVSRFFTGREINQATTRQIRRLVLGLGASIAALLYLIAPSLSRLMGTPSLVLAIRLSGLLFILVPNLSLKRGLYQARGNMGPTAKSQLSEQLIRVSVIISSAYLITQFNQSVEWIASLSVLASVLGVIVARIVMKGNEQVSDSLLEGEPNRIPMSTLFNQIVLFGMVMAINHMILLLLQTVDVVSLVPLLHRVGYSTSDAQLLKGVLDRAQPLSQLGVVASSSITLSLVPRVTAARKNKNQQQFNDSIWYAFKLSLYLSVAATAGLVLLMPKVNMLLFKDTAGTLSLQIFVFAIVFSSLSVTLATILQGFNDVYKTAGYVFIGVLSKALFNLLLIPHFELHGAALATVLASLLIFLLHAKRLTEHLKKVRISRFSFRPLLYSLATLIVSVSVFEGLFQSFFTGVRSHQLFYLIVIITVGTASFAYVLSKTDPDIKRVLKDRKR
ncbi:PST family polysaccharide transporter [Streptohalobacillus salinus]|uniref:PST family polysaccharide transporter n=1 Tax=Streptohalobacillus salinus TaxID=621096 RepID=A0A2V3W5K0_9BACI|nr:polysaccharide biosynthesis protein [Streptohalobacillus salinus]PXW88464.1 PST family polysaccharide transporter [Streptohalobacillus salinus]